MNIKPNAPIDMLLKAISEHLEARSKQAKLKKKDLARLADVNQNTITAIMSGGDTKLSTLIRITRVLDDIDWLLPLLKIPEPTPLDKLKATTYKAKVSLGRPSVRPMGRKKDEV